LGRIDHLEEDWRLVLQTAAVIGFVFRRSILEKVLTVDLDLEKALWELEGSGFIYRERSVPEVEYSFYHVLMQQVIYDNILPYRRKIIHQKATAVIETLYADNLEEYAEPLAYHSEQGGNIRLAIRYLYQSGAKARALDSNEAAIAYLTRGLELLRSLPETLERNSQELDYLTLIGVPLVLARGHTDPSILSVYEDALNLCRKTGDETHLFEALIGLRRYYLYQGPMNITLQLSHQIHDIAEKKQDADEQARACTLLAEVLYRKGDFHEAFEMGRQGEELARHLDPRSSISLYGNDTYLGALCWSSITLWHLGMPEQARRHSTLQLEHSHALSHPFSRAMVLALTAMLYILIREPRVVQRLAEEEVRVSKEGGFTLYQAIGTLQTGWALEALGRTTEGFEWIEKGLAGLRQMNYGLIAESHYPLFCDALLHSGQTEHCLELIELSLEAISRSGSLELEAELLRLKADGLSRQNYPIESEQSYLQAIQAARVHSSRGFELRAATGLARLWLDQGRCAEAKDLLQPLYTAFTEGFDTPDLLEAKLLFEHLNHEI
jgi:predicted ATPase